jgi:hypothetical protein
MATEVSGQEEVHWHWAYPRGESDEPLKWVLEHCAGRFWCDWGKHIAVVGDREIFFRGYLFGFELEEDAVAVALRYGVS